MGACLFHRSHRAGLLAGGKTTVSPPLNPTGLVFALGAYHLQDRSNESENSEKPTHNMPKVQVKGDRQERRVRRNFMLAIVASSPVAHRCSKR